ncbi:fungal-specific transcription factor domain-containing protein [Thelonectria olida]|uniref:Fungal-specific transcription factor domain-containing protein n=1 Tax=Thelonectria olida TaxID=1576542 RepID=A0A9P8VVF3_9HYPO|nr:fungal-specific transcription factor domain-containing protein [Thelonectria olida]
MMDATHSPTEKSPKDAASLRPACTECQRRKQKCNREWPCNHCQKRKVADKCNYRPETDHNKANSVWEPSFEVKRKRELESEAAGDEWDAGAGLEAIGYATSHLLSNLNIGSNGETPEQYRMHITQSPALQRALQILPPRAYIDSLVQNFVEDVNFYYYIVYPPSFIKEYAAWWKDRDADRPLGLQWTCLLIMICACSVQHTNAELAARLKNELGFSVKQLTDQYHNAARELHSAIPVGHSHIYSVQYLLHSCYWFKAEARFVECWQILGATVREAQALGLHQESEARMSEFDREMRRRLWCIVDSWDWLVSCLLARPMLINRSDSTVALPALTIENYPVSPLLHLKLQSELVGIIFKRFGPPSILDDHGDILEYQQILEDFMKTFPPAYGFSNPDTQPEKEYPWIALHRHYMHTCTLSITLGPFRPFMAKQMSRATPAIEQQFRRDGVSYALRLMNSVQSFFEWVWSRDSTFHFVPFCIFDTAALLCSALLHDADSSIPQRDNIVMAIDTALDTLKRLRTATDTAKKPYDVLRRLVQRARATLPNMPDESHRKRPRRDDERQMVPPVQASVPYNPVAHLPAQQAPHADAYANMPLAGPNSSPERGISSSTLPDTAVGQTPSPPGTSSPGDGVVLHSTISYDSYVPWGPGSPPGNQPIATAPIDGYQPVHHPISGQMQQQSMVGMHMENTTNSRPPIPQTYVPVPLDKGWSNESLGQGGLNMQQQGIAQDYQNVDGRILSEAELGDLADLWNWESLDLGFAANPIL